MSCINPINVSFKRHGNNFREQMYVPCGHCLECLIKKQSQLEFLAKKELLNQYQNGRAASFVTLTYDDDHIPFNENGFMTLRRKDVQLFLKNVRRQMDYYKYDGKFKVIYNGEYGDQFQRPHYHIIFFGLNDIETSMFTRKLWKYGICDVGPLTNGGIRYVLKYLQKGFTDSSIKKMNEECGIQNPFLYHSIGIGKNWIINNLYKIVENGFTFQINGKKLLFPRYVMRFVSYHTGVDYLPFVKKFINETTGNKIKAAGLKYNQTVLDQWQLEESIIRYQNNVQALRSKGMPVNDLTTNKKWIRPYHFIDRPFVTNLVNKAFKGFK